jgi:hypothetical protein
MVHITLLNNSVAGIYQHAVTSIGPEGDAIVFSQVGVVVPLLRIGNRPSHRA